MNPATERNTIDRKEFMKQVGISFGAIMLMNCLQSCGGGEIPDPDPDGSSGKVDFTLDMNNTSYTILKNKGGYVVVKPQNIIIAHTNADAFIAVSAICTHESTIINYRAATNDFLCPNHQSEFKADGSVQKGPATTDLKKYSVSSDLTNNTIRIFE
ncbi:ubiquinol-cytochrome c reductase iron-sulfur subunit [Emticicia sp. BO119]|uniref:QcrA and Rieske domain-containing protein n=1 Tax=Emticicia sp. BO119 TaxID=2757768 RepID=UPI0015EFE0AB|nr:Rieske (2Fe-2S) protein [Emticicia sp. BO119]MBA4853515.1 Rieske (2Fe-2S) protein [Emticicia sp. BO119]